MYHGKTLAVILCMHRSGSSLVANLLQRLGMSLGPFELAAAHESNKFGHFEAVPLMELNRDLQARALGFGDDLPESPALLHQFGERQGRWESEDLLTESDLARAQELLDRLVQSGPISGFKDPRTVLVWPMWRRLLARFSGLRVVLVLLARSPHEIAMSLFMRGKGRWTYRDALDVTAVNFARMLGIARQWEGDRAVVRFAPTVFAGDMRRAVELCGLTWREDVLAAVYDPECRHHESAVVDHPAQALFAQLAPPAAAADLPANGQRLWDDAALREATLHKSLLLSQEEIVAARQELAQSRQETARLHGEAEELARRLQECCQETAQVRQEAEESAQRLQECRQEAEESARRLQQCREEVSLLQQQAEESARRLQQCREERGKLHREAEEMAGHFQQCREEIRLLRREVARYRVSAEQLSEILGSGGWAFLQSLRRARLALAPQGSRREEIARQGLRVARWAAGMARSLSGAQGRTETVAESRDAVSGAAASEQSQPLHAWSSSSLNAGNIIVQGIFTVDEAPSARRMDKERATSETPG